MARPTKYNETMTRKSITVTQEQAAWMDAQENASEIIRDYINERMANEMDTPQNITIIYDNSEDSMYGNEGPDGIDTGASETKFEQLLMQEIRKMYPGTSVEVSGQHGRDLVRVDGDESSDEVAFINDAIGRIWSNWEWLIEL